MRCNNIIVMIESDGPNPSRTARASVARQADEASANGIPDDATAEAGDAVARFV